MKPTNQQVQDALRQHASMRGAADSLGVSITTFRSRVNAMRAAGALPKTLVRLLAGKKLPPPLTAEEVAERIAAASAVKRSQPLVGLYCEVRGCEPVGREGDLLLYAVRVAVSEPIDAGQVRIG